jgi:hypothetical protein
VIYKTGNTELHSWEDVKKSIHWAPRIR